MLDLPQSRFEVGLQLRFELEERQALRDVRLTYAETLCGLVLRAVELDQRLEGLSLLQVGEILPLSVGDEGGLQQDLVGGDAGVVDGDLDRSEVCLFGAGQAAVAVDDDVLGTGFQL
ncbi:hypothetical protein AMK29_30670 [Streptomyces sp. CB02261]|nr:hypothetical protein AMK29_30670 [Streptomyces sp. CB02261]